MAFDITILKKKLKKRRISIQKAISKAKESGYSFQTESQILRLSHVAFIDEILKWIAELEH